MARDLDLGVEIVGMPIVREPDGLAMSSRNAYLSPDERLRALALSRALGAAREPLRRRASATPARLVDAARATLAPDADGVRLDYLELRDAETLEPLDGRVSRPRGDGGGRVRRHDPTHRQSAARPVDCRRAQTRSRSLLKNELITGMVLLAPVAGTAYLVYRLVSGIDGLFPDELRPRLFGHPLPGLGVLSVLVLALLVGMFAHNFIGRRLVALLRSQLPARPAVRRHLRPHQAGVRVGLRAGRRQLQSRGARRISARRASSPSPS